MNEDRKTLVDVIKHAMKTYRADDDGGADGLAQFIATQVSGAGFRRR